MKIDEFIELKNKGINDYRTEVLGEEIVEELRPTIKEKIYKYWTMRKLGMINHWIYELEKEIILFIKLTPREERKKYYPIIEIHKPLEKVLGKERLNKNPEFKIKEKDLDDIVVLDLRGKCSDILLKRAIEESKENARRALLEDDSSSKFKFTLG